MRVLVINTGSATAKLAVLDAGPSTGEGSDGSDPIVVDSSALDPWDGDPGSLAAAIEGLARRSGPIDAVGHRVVHGGDRFDAPAVIDDEVRHVIAGLVGLAPLHQHRALAGIDAADRALGSVPAVACFDTSFHKDIPAPAATYALPREWRDRWDLRRRGFHGLSHAWAARRGALLAGADPARARVITCHLGGGSSLCAVRGGRSVDTTMGMTPLEGVVMTTRSGSVDPGLLLWLLTDGGLDVDEVADGLQHRGGMAGLAGPGSSGDLRALLPDAAAGDDGAAFAVEVYLYRLRAGVAAMAAALGGVDVVAFTGGAGQHQPLVRSGVIDGLAFLGLVIDAAANDAADTDADVSASGTVSRTVVVATGEEPEIARSVAAALG